MPVNGLVFAADELEIYISSTASGSHTGDGSGVYSHAASGETKYTPNTVDLLDGFKFQISGSSSSNQWSVTYTGPGSPFGTTWTGTGWASVNAKVVITDLRLYNTGGNWRLDGSYEVFAGGVSRITGSLAEAGGGLGPAYVPLIGVPFGIAGSCSAGTTGLPSYGLSSTYDYQSTTDATATGGWRFKEVGSATWITLPVEVHAISVPTVTCDVSETMPSVSATDTYGLSVPSHAFSRTKRTFLETIPQEITVTVECVPPDPDPPYIICQETGPAECLSGTAEWDTYTLENWNDARSGAVRAVPNLEKTIERFNGDFAALVYRTEMPATVKRRSASCTDGGTTTDTDDSTVHPYQAELLQLVQNLTADIEDTLAYESYAPVSANASATYTKVHQPISQCTLYADPPSWFTCDTSSCPYITTTDLLLEVPTYVDDNVSWSGTFSFPYSVGASSDMAGYLGHDSALARYVNSWCNPHWSFALYNEPWEVDSSPQTWANYWSLVGSQWLDDSTLPALERHKTRNHLVSEGLENDGNIGFLNTYFSGLRWLGVSRWTTKEVAPRTTYTYTSGSSSLWSATSATLTHGSSITVNPSASPCEVELNIGSFTVEPYQWPHLADTITVDWVATNITDCKVYLEGADGTRVLLNDNQPGVAKARPQGTTTEYAGSWDQDFGALVVTDQGSDDISPDGVSSTVMGSAERAFAFQMLCDFTAEKLVYVIEVSDVDTDCTIEYPQFDYTLSEHRLITPENAHQSCVIHPDGPGTRYGFWNTGTSGTVNNPPAIYDGYVRPNTIDWLVTERLAIRGVAYNDNLTTELTSLRDTFEGQSVGNERNSSWGFWLPNNGSGNWNLALVSGMAEVPPLGCFPRRERNIVTWLESGASWVQHAWVWAQEPDYFVNPEKQVDLKSGTVWTGLVTAVSGWKRTSHVHELNNTETGAKIIQGATEYATVRPWRGHYSVICGSEDSGAVAYCTLRDGTHYRAYTNSSGAVVTETSDNLLSWNGATQAFNGTHLDLFPVITVTGGSKVGLLYSDGGVVYLRESTDGVTWGVATAISSGSSNTHSEGVSTGDGRRFIYWRNSAGEIRGTELDAAGTVIGSAGFNTTITCDDVGFGCDYSDYGQGRRRIVIEATVSGTVTQYVSTDGRTFS